MRLPRTYWPCSIPDTGNDGSLRRGRSMPRNVSTRMCKMAARSDRASGSYIECRNRPMQTLKSELPRLLGRGERLHRRLDFAVDENLAVGGFAAQARRQVDHGADRGVVEASFEADATERGVPLSDADTKAEFMAVLAPFGGKTATPSRISTAMRTARTEGSGHGSGSLNQTIRPSPAKRSSVASYLWMSLPSVAMIFAQDLDDLLRLGGFGKAVKPRKSQNTTVISRRWLSRTFSPPEETMSSAICGERNLLRRSMRSISPNWSATRCSSVRFHCASSSAWSQGA